MIGVGLSWLEPIAAWQPDSNRTVEFFVSDGWGGEIKQNVLLTLFPAGGATVPYLVNYPEKRSVRLPPGNYTALINARGFLSKTRDFQVEDGDIFLPIAVTLAPIESSGGDRILGRILGTVGQRLKGQAPMWIRLVGVHSDVNRTTKVDGAGHFTLDKIPPGRYEVMVFANGVLKESRTIDVRFSDNIIAVE